MVYVFLLVKIVGWEYESIMVIIAYIGALSHWEKTGDLSESWVLNYAWSISWTWSGSRSLSWEANVSESWHGNLDF